MEKTLIINRKRSFIAKDMPCRVIINGQQVGVLSNGASITLPCPDKSFEISIQMDGDGIRYMPIVAQTTIKPALAPHGVHCQLVLNGIANPRLNIQVKYF